MIDWTASMQQSFEIYEVDPDTWGDVRLIEDVTSCSITRDGTSTLLESATIECDENLGECYLRIYLKAIQNGSEERFPLGTFLVQTSSTQFDGKVIKTSLDAYSPLIELKDKLPPVGYTAMDGVNVMQLVYNLTNENLRPPVIEPESDVTLYSPYTSDFNESWLTYLSNLMNFASFEFGLDESSRIIFTPVQKLAALQPVWRFTDDNSSILQADLSIDKDLYGVPNVVEVYYSNGPTNLSSRIVNSDPNSIISTVNRGREVVHRVQNPSFYGIPSQAILDEYATKLLEQLSTLEYKVSYTHGYCPVRIGDCVMLSYEKAGLDGIKAKVTNQTINCQTGIQVSETAIYTQKLWG